LIAKVDRTIDFYSTLAAAQRRIGLSERVPPFLCIASLRP
jgi:hypothetical protein